MGRYKSKKRPSTPATAMHKVNGEPWGGRHNRRLAVAMEHERIAYAFSEKHGITFRIGNFGHHWQFRKLEWKADWWPVSAHLVLNQAWSSGIHCQDVGQVIEELQRHGWTNPDNFKRYCPEAPLSKEEVRTHLIGEKEISHFLNDHYGPDVKTEPSQPKISMRQRIIIWLGGKP